MYLYHYIVIILSCVPAKVPDKVNFNRYTLKRTMINVSVCYVYIIHPNAIIIGRDIILRQCGTDLQGDYFIDKH